MIHLEKERITLENNISQILKEQIADDEEVELDQLDGLSDVMIT